MNAMKAILKLSWPHTRQYWELPVLHIDEHLLALDKPSDLPLSPARDEPAGPGLIQMLRRDIERGAQSVKELGLSYIANTHRLDAETSGVVLCARNKQALVAMANSFGSEKPMLSFITLVQGNPSENSFEVDKKLAPHPSRAGAFRVDHKQGKKARTQFELIERFNGFALLKCTPLTCRPHQIPAHLHWLKLPVVGDQFHGGKPLRLSQLKPSYRPKLDEPEKPLIGRPAVHSSELTFPHPASGEPLSVMAPWPRDIAVGVKYLRRFRAAS
jgi:RluA family pseudouridine synthase